MNSQRVSSLVKKDLKKLIREPATLFLIILFPVILTLAFGASFGTIGGTQSTTYEIGVINTGSAGPYQQWSQHFIGNLTNAEILKISDYSDNETAQEDLIQGKIQAVLLIPENFGQSCDSFWKAPTDPSLWVNTTLQLYLDSGSLFATQAIPPIIQQVLEVTIYGGRSIPVPRPIQIGSPSLVQASKLTMFDYMAPGIFAYAAIFLTMTVAQSFTTDRENGLLRRINTTPTTPTEFMMSQMISNMVTALVQVALVFAMAHLVGYRPNGDASSFAMAFIIVSLFSLCNVGFGLITATIAKSSGAATGLSFVFIMPQMFLGTFVGFALSPSAQAAGKFVPSYYVTDALTSLFLRGAPLSSPTILLDLVVVSIYSVTALFLGILLFRKYGRT
ncbi:MAG: ABC transporter permease [Candidatus Bathyarchaeota archaeon]|nr:MAG: ABC transporter permease [Candidatus Bathyarchaeota archaeon]